MNKSKKLTNVTMLLAKLGYRDGRFIDKCINVTIPDVQDSSEKDLTKSIWFR